MGNVVDAKWHMATVTSRDDRKDGFSMYIDGVLAGEMVEGSIYTGQ